MNSLELYINGEKGGFHTFIEVHGSRRTKLDFTHQDIDTMLLEAEKMIRAGGYEERLRVYDPKHRMVMGSDGISWISLKQLGLWTHPKGRVEPQPDESVLGRALDAAGRPLTAFA
jgi:hypothetical protein